MQYIATNYGNKIHDEILNIPFNQHLTGNVSSYLLNMKTPLQFEK